MLLNIDGSTLTATLQHVAIKIHEYISEDCQALVLSKLPRQRGMAWVEHVVGGTSLGACGASMQKLASELRMMTSPHSSAASGNTSSPTSLTHFSSACTPGRTSLAEHLTRRWSNEVTTNTPGGANLVDRMATSEKWTWAQGQTLSDLRLQRRH